MKILLHICCAPCATHCINLLKNLGYEVVGFFYNPNIHPPKEYERRKAELEKIRKYFEIDVIEWKYDVENWFKYIKGYEKEREGGKRCELCIKMRLEETAKYARMKGFDAFTTTLTISPWKNSKKIFEIGRKISEKYNIRFLEIDFKKNDGFKKSVELSKRYNMYRQKYCGCIFSYLDRLHKNK